MFLTIFTPTYNRAYILPRLYHSLRTQGSRDFEWVVVDDGSTDGTEELIRDWIEDAAIVIKYIKQEHGGKARAHNRAVIASRAPFFMVIDSDDVFVPGGVSLIYEHLHHLDDPGISHLLFSCSFMDGRENLPFPPTGTILRLPRFRAEYHCEVSPVFKTSILRNYLYPEFEGEDYMTPSYIWYQMSERYAGYVIDAPLRLIEYLPDGLTFNRGPLKYGNWRGWTLAKNQNLQYASGFGALFRTAGIYDAYAILSGKRHPISSSTRPVWALMALPAGVCYMLRVIISVKSKKMEKQHRGCLHL